MTAVHAWGTPAISEAADSRWAVYWPLSRLSPSVYRPGRRTSHGRMIKRPSPCSPGEPPLASNLNCHSPRYRKPWVPVRHARFSSRFSRSRSLILLASDVVVSGRRPAPTATCLHQPRNVSGWTPTRDRSAAPPRSTTTLAPARGPRRRAAAPAHATRAGTASVLARLHSLVAALPPPTLGPFRPCTPPASGTQPGRLRRGGAPSFAPV